MLKISYSIINAWAQGNHDRAVDMYLKRDTFMTRQMQEGRDMHEAWAEESRATNRLPKVFGAKPLTSPRIEEKRLVQLSDWLMLSGIPDLQDNKVIHEYKTGVTESDAYARTKQPNVYQVLCYQDAPKMCVIHHYNQYTKEVDVSYIHLTKQTMKDGAEWIITYSSEFYDYIQNQGIVYHSQTQETN